MYHTDGLTLPNESTGYREARDRLLLREQELRALTQVVAQMRSALPVGGALANAYEFTECHNTDDKSGVEKQVQFSELFSGHSNSLMIYSLMFGENDARPCPMCTAFLDGLNGDAIHLNQRINLAVVAKAPAAKLRSLAQSRNWRNLRILSSSETSFNHDYYAESDEAQQMPVLNIFSKDGQDIHHRYLSELLYTARPTGGDPRHVDANWALWNVLDLVPEGRSDWYPSLSYA